MRPSTAPRGQRTRFAFRAAVEVAGRLRPVAGVRVRFAGKVRRTGRRGRARIVAKLAGHEVWKAFARKRGFRRGRPEVRLPR